jgi:DNA-binding NarL/FixJ family response regulator
MIEIIITDDHPIVRQGLKKILEENTDMRVIAEAGSASDLLDQLKSRSFDILVLDISLPGRSGLDLMTDIKAISPSLQILIVSIHPEEQYAMRALKLGASGYLSKTSLPEELISAVRKISLGKKYITVPLAEKIASNTSEYPPYHKLSNRELEVMRLLAQGNTPGNVAQKLSLSVKTISTYRSRIIFKLNLKTTSEIIRYAIREGLVI